jgi:hypothetical protein
MLELVPKSWASWDFAALYGSQAVADIDTSCWREKGVLTIQGASYPVYREGWVSGDFILESAGAVLARARKPSAMRRTFLVEHAGKRYTLRTKSAFGRTFLLQDGSQQIGAISPEGIFTRRAKVDLPESMPLPVKIFILWLAVLIWKRDSEV